MKAFVFLFVVAVLLVAPRSEAGLFDPVQNPYPFAEPISLAGPFNFVGALYLTSVSGYEIPASGVLIAPNKVLTAAHCVFDYEGLPAESMQFVLGADVLGDPRESVQVARWDVHPSYNGIGGPGDLAVLTLSQSVTTATPVSLFSDEYVLGTQLVMVGYGRPGVVGEGYQSEFDGIRRAGYVYPSEYGGLTWLQDYLSNRFYPPGWPGYDPMGLMGTPGDSGGGWFIYNNGSWELVGLTAINGGIYDYFGRTGAVRLDDYNGYRDWVIRHISTPKAVPQPAPLGSSVTPVEVRRYP